jgi:hypothetical protein
MVGDGLSEYVLNRLNKTEFNYIVFITLTYIHKLQVSCVSTI